MLKIVVLALLLFMPSAYAAAPCPPPATFYDGFSGQFFKTPTYTPKTKGFIYGLDEQMLYVTFANGAITTFTSVPQSVPTQFIYSTNPDTFYSTQILHIYTESATCGSPPLG